MSIRNPRDEAIFEGALQLPEERRETYLHAACGSDSELLKRVRGLLSAHDHEDGPLEKPAVTPHRPTINLVLPPTEKPGDRIGPYKLLQQIGEGGCGVVYMAEQEQPVRRRVALKVIKLGMDTKQVIARFEAERQALALMDHPNIARVLDAGATETGRPFFVMELVRGIKITEYCDQNNLSTQQRLKLFVHVCRAIQHAHQKGIIHRDIKPSNILVTHHDGVAVPKVIDFGIAKATDQKLTDKTLFTQFEQFIGTPAYMSPEQAEMSGLDIDTRSDIYSLGVLLYELLTSRTPFDPKELMAAGVDAMRRVIREKEPPRPSTRLSTMLAADLTTVARQRHAAVPKLIHLLQGDLDWVVMKALEKDRTRRYESASGFANDIERYLTDEPVVARPPSQIYRLQKLVRRNKLAFSAGMAIAASIVIGFGISTWLFIREKEARRLADTEAKRSQQVALLLEETLKGVGPMVALGRDTALLKDIMDKAVERVTKDLKDQPDVQAELCNTIGEVYRALGQYDKAETLHRGARSLQGKAPGRNRADASTSLNDLALVLRDRGKFAEAEALHREALTLRKKSLGNEHPDVAETLNNLALVLRSQGRLGESEEMHRQALAIQKKAFGNEHMAVATSLNNLGLVLRDRGKTTDAENSVREALVMQKRFFGNNHPAVAVTLDNLAFILREQGRLAESEALQRQALAMQKQFEGGEHPYVATALNNLALVLEQQGRVAEAEALHREALARRIKALGEEHLEVASSLDNLALLLRSLERLDEAENLERQALALRRKLVGEENPAVLGSFNNLALILRDQGKLAEAEGLLRDAFARQRKLFTDAHPSVAASFRNLLDVLLRERKTAEADALLSEVVTPAMEQRPEGARLLRVRAGIRARAGQLHPAVADLTQAVQLAPDNLDACDSLAILLAQSDGTESYRKHCARILAQFGATKDPFVAERVARDCLLLPAPGVDVNAAEKLADMAYAASTNHGNPKGFRLVKGLADYRQGRYSGTLERLADLGNTRANSEPFVTQTLSVLAMARQKSKQATEAQKSLAQAIELAGTKLPKSDSGDLGSDWYNVMVARTLLKEATALIPGTQSASLGSQ